MQVQVKEPQWKIMLFDVENLQVITRAILISDRSLRRFVIAPREFCLLYRTEAHVAISSKQIQTTQSRCLCYSVWCKTSNLIDSVNVLLAVVL